MYIVYEFCNNNNLLLGFPVILIWNIPVWNNRPNRFMKAKYLIIIIILICNLYVSIVNYCLTCLSVIWDSLQGHHMMSAARKLLITSSKEDMFSSSFCLLATLRKNFQTDLHEIFREGWQWANEQMIKFWWLSGSPSGYGDCFPDSSLLGDTETRINQLCCMTLQCRACSSRHRHNNYDVIASAAHDRQPWQTYLGGGMHCLSASGCLLFC